MLLQSYQYAVSFPCPQAVLGTQHDIEARCSIIQCSQQETRVRHVAVRYFFKNNLRSSDGNHKWSIYLYSICFYLEYTTSNYHKQLSSQGFRGDRSYIRLPFFSFRVRGILGSREENTFPQIDLPLTETIQQVEYHHWDS